MIVNIRRAVTLLALFLLAFTCAGCSKKDSNRPKLVLLTSGGPIRKGVEKAVQEFLQGHPDVDVQIVTTPGKDYYVKSLTMLAGRAHVDLLWMGQGFGMFASRGALLDLSPLVAREPEVIANLHPDVLDWYRLNERLYGIPYGIDSHVIAYNKSLFAKGGVPLPSPDWTLDDFFAIARRLQRVDANGRIEVAGAGMSDLDYRYFDLSLLDENNERFALNTPVGLEWMKRSLTLLHEQRLLHRGNEMQAIDRLSRFFNGRAAMMVIATWDIAELRNRTPFDWDVVRLPKNTAGQNVTWASSAGFSISRHSKHPELAWQLLKKLVNTDFQRTMFETIIPVNTTLKEEFLAAHPAPPAHLGEFFAAHSGLRPNPRITAFQEVEREWQYWYEQAMLRKITPEAALSNAEHNINRILELHRKEASQP